LKRRQLTNLLRKDLTMPPENADTEATHAATDGANIKPGAGEKPNAKKGYDEATAGMETAEKAAFKKGVQFAGGHFADVLQQADPSARRETLVELVRTNTPD
jgi:hypothetical protein